MRALTVLFARVRTSEEERARDGRAIREKAVGIALKQPIAASE